MDMPVAPGPDMQSQPPAGQDIVSAAQKLAPDDLNALFRGISPEACEAMEKIPQLSGFANFIESGGKSTQEDPDQPGKRPGIAIVIGVGKGPRDPREDIRAAAAQHGVK